eukprot:RCo054268
MVTVFLVFSPLPPPPSSGWLASRCSCVLLFQFFGLLYILVVQFPFYFDQDALFKPSFGPRSVTLPFGSPPPPDSSAASSLGPASLLPLTISFFVSHAAAL